VGAQPASQFFGPLLIELVALTLANKLLPART
jgi:hypothetical protein